MKRFTRQREAIRHALSTAGRPLSATELVALARKTMPGVGTATVYRHLKMMSDRGEVVAIRLPEAPRRYEPSGRKHHHFFVCDACSRMYEVPDCASGLGRLAPRGFRVERHEILLYGRCSACAGRSNRAVRESRRARQ
jgi:Fur family ferric uptake transcriptional regulator